MDISNIFVELQSDINLKEQVLLEIWASLGLHTGSSSQEWPSIPSLLNIPCPSHTSSLKNKTYFHSCFCYSAIFLQKGRKYFLWLPPLLLLEIYVYFSCFLTLQKISC